MFKEVLVKCKNPAVDLACSLTFYARNTLSSKQVKNFLFLAVCQVQVLDWLRCWVLRRPQEKTVDFAVAYVALAMTVREDVPLLTTRNDITVSQLPSQYQVPSLKIVYLAGLDLTIVKLF